MPREGPLLEAAMLGRLAERVPVSVAICAGWFAWRHAAGVPIDTVRTEVFTLLAFAQWFNVLNCRSATRSALRGGLRGNRWLGAGLAASFALQAAVLYLPPPSRPLYTSAAAA